MAANVEAGLAVYRNGGHDGVIAFGGGSALDAGKVIAFMAGQTRPMWDFEDVGDWWTRANPDGIAPIVAVPTTSGTGSEVGRAGVITDETTHTKKIIFHPKMMPRVALLDPELTIGLPAKLTAGVGMDALSHCLEAYCAPGFHPLADGVALEGMRLVKDYLPRAVRTGTDIEARGMMMAAAAMGATAFQKGLGAMHALSHPIGRLHGTHHGMTNAVFMPYVLEHNRRRHRRAHRAGGGLSGAGGELRRVPRLGAEPAAGGRRAAHAGRARRAGPRGRQDRADGAGRSHGGQQPGGADGGRGAEDFRGGAGREAGAGVTVIPANAGIQGGRTSAALSPRLRGDDRLARSLQRLINQRPQVDLRRVEAQHRLGHEDATTCSRGSTQ